MKILRSLIKFAPRLPIDSFEHRIGYRPEMPSRLERFAEFLFDGGRQSEKRIMHKNGHDYIDISEGLFVRTAHHGNSHIDNLSITLREPTKLTYALGLGLTFFAAGKAYEHFSESKPAADLESAKEGQSPSL